MPGKLLLSFINLVPRTLRVSALGTRLEFYLVQALLKFHIVSKKKGGTETGPGLSRYTLTASACVRLYDISKVHAFPVLVLEKKEW